MTGNSGINSLSGGDGNDALYGMAGNDSLFAWNGADILVGGDGNDTMYGDMGADAYRFDASFGQDIIEDNGQNGTTEIDRIEFSTYNTTDLTFSLANGGLDLVISVVGSSDSITVKNHFATAKQDWLEEIQFANGTIWNRAAINAAVGLPPIVFDLDGDGVELVSSQTSKVRFDSDNDGRRQRTGWVGRDDGLLALDRNGDGRIGSGAEISFVSDLAGARTDLEGLAAFDTNRNCLLDAGDEGFSKFRIWRDANQDGVSQKSELRSLSAWGVASIDLSPSETFERPLGVQDNFVAGMTRVTRRDGSTGVAADVVLAYDHGSSQPKTPKAAASISSLFELGRAADRFGLDRFAGRHAALSPDDETATSGQRDPTSAAAGLAGAVDLATGMYGLPQREVEAMPFPQASADVAAPEAASGPGLTMYGEPQREAEAASTARELLDVIRGVRYAAPAQGGWGADRWARILQDEDGAAELVASSLKRPPVIYDREVLQMVEAMAGFSATPAGELTVLRGRVPIMDLSALAADLRVA